MRVFAVLLMMLFACPGGVAELAPRASACMPEPAESVVLELAVGEERVALELPSNPTTGFQWELAEPQRSAVVAVELSYVAPQQPEGEELLCGAPGVMQVRLRGLQPGTERVLLHYRRCWEADVPPAEQCVLQVRVRE